MDEIWALVVVPVGLGLLGFVEPCTVGSSLLFVKYLEGKRAAEKLLETVVFAATRAVFIGGLGAAAGLVGSLLLGLQRGFWIFLGAIYLTLGLIYLARRQSFLMRVFGPRLARVGKARGAAALGVLFGLNIPACAAPLLAVVMGASLGAASVAQGFLMMALFGLALSVPLVVLVLSGRARRWLDRLAALSARVPFWIGIVFVVLGAWSILWGLRPPDGGQP
jgi:cytochrome c-type biogenesis protein